MRSTAAATVAAVLLGGCTTLPRTADDVRPPSSPAPTPSASATRSAPPAPDAHDRRLARAFIAFATAPSAETAGHVPFAEEIGLGLGREIRATLASTEAGVADSWVLPDEEFRAYVGPFDLLDGIRGHQRGFQVSVGDHPHCAGPPVAAPKGFAEHRRISVQPAGRTIDSCLSWFTVDLFVGADGRIDAVTLDLWEP